MSDILTLKFDTLEVVAASIAAFELNNGYVKTSEYDYNNNQILEHVKKYPNKELVRAYFGVDHYSVDAPKPPLVKITDQHRAKAVEIQNYSKKNIFKILSRKTQNNDPLAILGPSSSYEEDLYQLLNQDTVDVSAFGYIASSPLYYENEKIKDFRKTRLEDLDSEHVGIVGGRVSLNNFEVIRNTKSKNFDGHVIQGICEGNLFLYFSSKPCSHIKVGDVIHIDGKIKDHIIDYEKIPVTKLTYVVERNINNANITQTPIVRINSDSDLFG
jgi:hypothetical protein